MCVFQNDREYECVMVIDCLVSQNSLYVLHYFFCLSENALKDDRVSRATAMCRKLVRHFSHSWKKKAALTEAQRELKLPEHNLITECPTRWGSKEMMIARVLEQAKAISQVLSGERYARSLIPTWQDIDVLESIHKALHPLLKLTDALSGEEYVSISYLKPVLHLFATSVLADDAEDTYLTKSIKSIKSPSIPQQQIRRPKYPGAFGCCLFPGS